MVKNVQSIPGALALLREIRDASIEDVAAATGIHRATLYRIERGRQDMEKVKLSTFTAITRWLDEG